jgi:pimeloyl-ACP methyl ester carboxylesterase
VSVERGAIGRWVSADAEREFMGLDEALRQEAWQRLCEQGWPTVPSEADIETRFGSTRVYRWAGTGVPLVLLHGSGTSSLMWTPLLAQLVGRSVCALDTIGDPGRSVQRAPMRDRNDLATWLDEVLDGLQLDRVNLLGASYGGWIGLNHALRSPQRVATLTLLDPVVEKIRPMFFVHGIACGIALLLPAPMRRWAAQRLHMNALATDDKRIRRWGFLGQAKYRRGAPRFVPITDEELASITAPTLLLLAEKSQVHRSRPLLARARAAMPPVEAELIAAVGHAFPVDQPEEIGPRIRAFLDLHAPNAHTERR